MNETAEQEFYANDADGARDNLAELADMADADRAMHEPDPDSWVHDDTDPGSIAATDAAIDAEAGALR